MESSLVRKSNNNNNRNIDIKLSSLVPSRENLKNLELSDLIIMASISHDFDKIFKYFFKRDAFTLSVPFKNPENYLYYLFVDRNNRCNVISLVVIRNDINIEKGTWDKIRGDDIVMLEIKPEQANYIKDELMPKEINNFYPFRKDGKIIGYIMFAYQICGLQNAFEYKTIHKYLINGLEVIVTFAQNKFDANGKLIDESIQKYLRQDNL